VFVTRRSGAVRQDGSATRPSVGSGPLPPLRHPRASCRCNARGRPRLAEAAPNSRVCLAAARGSCHRSTCRGYWSRQVALVVPISRDKWVGARGPLGTPLAWLSGPPGGDHQDVGAVGGVIEQPSCPDDHARRCVSATGAGGVCGAGLCATGHAAHALAGRAVHLAAGRAAQPSAGRAVHLPGLARRSHHRPPPPRPRPRRPAPAAPAPSPPPVARPSPHVAAISHDKTHLSRPFPATSRPGGRGGLDQVAGVVGPVGGADVAFEDLAGGVAGE
jgi:hypothetical protein